MTAKAPLRIVIVDDSATARAALAAAFAEHAGVTVIGQASNGDEALRLIKRLRPDLVTMDVYLKGHTGIEVTRAVMTECPTPILAVTAAHPTDPTLAFKAVEAGALDICSKLPSPQNPSYKKEAHRLIRLVRTLASVPVVRRHPPRARVADGVAVHAPRVRRARGTLVAIGASTGGPPLVSSILKELPVAFSTPVVVVQHITPGFGPGFADWLGAETGKRVVYVQGAVRIRPNHVYVAGDQRHLVVDSSGHLSVDEGPPVHHQRPSIDVFFGSAARMLGQNAVGVLLTGMGSDGAKGLAAMRAAGGLTIAQTPTTCAVASMPASAIALGAALLVLDPESIAEAIAENAATPGIDEPDGPQSERYADRNSRNGKGDAP